MTILFANGVWRIHGLRAGVDVNEMPGGNFSLRVKAGLGINDRCRTEIRPCEFLPARPSQRNGFAGGLGEPSRFHRAFAGMFAAETAAKIGDHAAPIFPL